MKLDSGTKNFQPSNLEVVKINIENSADNVIPAEATATFNIRFNNKHSSTSLKKKLNNIFSNACRKSSCSFKISYMISGEAFLTTPNKTTYMIQKIIKKITKIKPKLSTTGGTSDARFIRKISPEYCNQWIQERPVHLLQTYPQGFACPACGVPRP